MDTKDLLHQIKTASKDKVLQINTLGAFEVSLNGNVIDDKAWGRDKTIQLFQYLIISRNRSGLHKEMIVDRLWEDSKNGDGDFKVALHGIKKNLEPDKSRKEESLFIKRQGISYQLRLENISIDIENVDRLIDFAHENLESNPSLAKDALKEVSHLYKGSFLPNRIYEDWASAERERIHLAAMNANILLAEILLDENPNESMVLAQKVLTKDPTWEEAYRIIMTAFMNKGNRPQAIKTYENCEAILQAEYGVSPLPQTQQLLAKIKSI